MSKQKEVNLMDMFASEYQNNKKMHSSHWEWEWGWGGDV